MKSRKLTVIIVSLCMCVSVLTGCGSTAEKEQGVIIKANDKVKAANDPENMLKELATSHTNLYWYVPYGREVFLSLPVPEQPYAAYDPASSPV